MAIAKVTVVGGSIIQIAAAKRRSGFIIQNLSETDEVWLAMEGSTDFTDGDGAKPGFRLGAGESIFMGLGENTNSASARPVLPINSAIHGTTPSGTDVVVSIQEFGV